MLRVEKYRKEPLHRPVDPLKTQSRSTGQQHQVDQTLERVLASAAFRNSKQCQKFLRYVVEHSHAGNDELLKERCIGMEVFGRDADYDTAADPVVRVRATEVRKRLSQYYGESPLDDDVRFEMPQGSYRADIHWPGPAPAQHTGPKPISRRRIWPIVATFGAVCIAMIAYLAWPSKPQPTAVDTFWAPVVESPRPVLLYCGQPVVYFLSREVHDKYRDGVPADKKRGSYALTLEPDATLHGRDIIPVTDQFVGIGNAHTAALLTGFFAARHKTVEIRYANDLSFSDLRNSSSVLIGAFSNLWTLEMTSQLRFVFEQENGLRRIRDRAKNRTWQLPNIAPDGKTSEDYALVTRLFDSASGQLLLSAAGITQYGTRSAGEFLTDPVRLQQAFASAKPDWPKRNIQVLLHTTIYKGTPAAPKILAIHVW